MAKIKTSSDQIEQFHLYGLYLPTRTIYLGSDSAQSDGDEAGIDCASAAKFVKNLTILDSISNEPITVILNSPGGDTVHGIAIYDAIRACQSHVTVIVHGSCDSMASVIFQAADTRIMTPNSQQMLHYGYTCMDASDRDAHRFMENAKRVSIWMETVYLARIQQVNPSFTVEDIRSMLAHDTYFTATECLKWGLTDEIHPIKA